LVSFIHIANSVHVPVVGCVWLCWRCRCGDWCGCNHRCANCPHYCRRHRMSTVCIHYNLCDYFCYFWICSLRAWRVCHCI